MSAEPKEVAGDAPVAQKIEIREISKSKCFNGIQCVYEHPSQVLGCPMRFSVFIPPQANENTRVPVLYFLSGLTCSEQNFITKGGFQKYAADAGICVVGPDTSPRGLNVPGEDESYDLGTGAGFYIDATEEPWKNGYQMYTYIVHELPVIISKIVPVNDRKSIFGHSMGGHGALVAALKNPGHYLSVSAFAPICAPSESDWGKKAFTAYLGADKNKWAEWDATQLVKQYKGEELPILIDQGMLDEFYFKDLQLRPEVFFEASLLTQNVVQVNFRKQAGYDHSYYFISTFMESHIKFHAKELKADQLGRRSTMIDKTAHNPDEVESGTKIEK